MSPDNGSHQKPSLIPAEHPDPDLILGVKEARRVAFRNLMVLRNPEGIWMSKLDVSSFYGAIYIIMLRTTGLIEQSGSMKQEELLLRHMIHQVNPDGGFFKYPGSASCRSLTLLILKAIRLAMGEIAPGRRPDRWFRPNEAIAKDLSTRLREKASRAEGFLGGKNGCSRFSFELTHSFIGKALRGFVDPSEGNFPPPLVRPEFLAWMRCSSHLSKVHNQFHPLLLGMLPAIFILSQGIRRQRTTAGPTSPPLRRVLGIGLSTGKGVQDLATLILAEQDENGGWCYNSLYTMLNIMALHEAGVPLDDPSIGRALLFLRSEMHPASDGGLFINFMRADLWDTCLGLASYLSLPGHTCQDEEIRLSIQFLLSSQNKDGSFSFASGSGKNPDGDSTAFALRILSLAGKTASASLQLQIQQALARGGSYLVSCQSKCGGFNVFGKGKVRRGGASSGAMRHSFLDLPSPDLTARVLYTLAELGMTEQDAAVRRAIRYLLDTQHRNGAWWCRWWTGYIPGTDFVLDAFSRMGFRYGPHPYLDDPLLARAHHGMVWGIRFLLQHQNPDGGWGETVQADLDIRWAGKGESRPLQSASVLHELITCGYPVTAPEIRQGVRYLLQVMTPDGRWEDGQATFTVIPGSFYYQYPLMNNVIPLMALNAYLKGLGRKEIEDEEVVNDHGHRIAEGIY